jgi:hypothetical protein
LKDNAFGIDVLPVSPERQDAVLVTEPERRRRPRGRLRREERLDAADPFPNLERDVYEDAGSRHIGVRVAVIAPAGAAEIEVVLVRTANHRPAET